MDTPQVAVVIEDDHDIRRLISSVLTQSGFTVHAAASGQEGVAAVREYCPSIVTLDVGLPDFDGFEAARQIRMFSDAYILMLTARSNEIDTVLGFKSGADDYINKPFRPFELRARVSAMLRRSRNTGPLSTQPPGTIAVPTAVPAEQPVAPAYPQAAGNDGGAAETVAPGTYNHDGLSLDYPTRTVTVNATAVELTRTEFELLLTLMDGGRTVRSKQDLVRRLRFEEFDTGSFVSEADERAVEVHMANLRRKLGDDPRAPRWLETVRGFGYRMAPSAVAR